jgi:hypothetical protein
MARTKVDAATPNASNTTDPADGTNPQPSPIEVRRSGRKYHHVSYVEPLFEEDDDLASDMDSDEENTVSKVDAVLSAIK